MKQIRSLLMMICPSNLWLELHNKDADCRTGLAGNVANYLSQAPPFIPHFQPLATALTAKNIDNSAHDSCIPSQTLLLRILFRHNQPFTHPRRQNSYVSSPHQHTHTEPDSATPCRPCETPWRGGRTASGRSRWSDVVSVCSRSTRYIYPDHYLYPPYRTLI